MSRPLPRHLPTEDERLLLRAACLETGAAGEAWAEWRKGHDLQTACQTSISLLPAVYRNLRRSSALEQADSSILGGTYRLAWVHNNILFGLAATALRALAQRGIETVLLKGAALSVDVYRDAGARPMADIDFLVPLDRVEEAYGLLLADGWAPEVPLGCDLNRAMQVVRSTDLIRPDGMRLDLHWHVLAECCDEDDDVDFWSAAHDIRLNNVPTRALCPSDLLLHAIVHGCRWTFTRSLLWVMDAHKICVEQSADLDWGRLVDQSRKRALVLPVLNGLLCLRETTDLAVPEPVLMELKRARPSLLDRLDYRSQDTEDNLRGVVLREVAGYLKRTQRRSTLQRLRAVPWYLQTAWGIPNPVQLPYHAALRLFRRGSAILRPTR